MPKKDTPFPCFRLRAVAPAGMCFVLCACAPPAGETGLRREPLPVAWHRPTAGACIELGREGEFDSDHLFAPCVMQHGEGYRMFYCGSGPETNRLFKVGIADSGDGLTWTKRPGNPVLAFGDQTTSLVTPALLREGRGWVRRENGRLRMWVNSVDFNTADMIHRLHETTSADDGVTWGPLSEPLMENIYAPTVLWTRGEYRMWYVDVSANQPWTFRAARSGDGTHWEPLSGDPVLKVDQDWEHQSLFYPCVVDEGDRYLMWYGSYWNYDDHRRTALGLAVSDDGIYWQKYADNPIIRPDENRPFESNYCTSQTVLPRCVKAESSVPVLGAIPFFGAAFRSHARVCDGYQIWYATRNPEWRKYKYFAIGTAVSIPDASDKAPIVAGPAFSMSIEKPGDPRLEPRHFLARYSLEAPPSHAFAAKTIAEWEQWHTEFTSRLADVIGLDAFSSFPLQVTEGPVETFDDYTRHAYTIETAPGMYVPAFLLVPKGEKKLLPSILCSHGHGIGMNALVGLNADGTPRPAEEDEYQHDFALQAVRQGYVTLVFDQMGFGRRRDFGFNEKHNLGNACEQPSEHAIHAGTSMTGIRVYDAMRMIDFLQSRPEVDRDRIGMVGISGGGLVTQFTAALDHRVKAACVSGYCNRFDACILGIRHCIDNYVPGIGRLADNDDVACLIAPRPLLIEAGTQDPIFPIAATRAALRKLRRCYALLNATRSLEADIFDAGHQFSGAKTWTFFAKHLGGGAPATQAGSR